MDKKIPFEAANVAPDIAVWTRFWVLISLYFWNIFNGILAIIIANSAPMMDVFVLIPNLAINSRPMIEPIIHKFPPFFCHAMNEFRLVYFFEIHEKYFSLS